MNPTWQDFLSAAGAQFDNGQLAHFGNPQQEITATPNANILSDLSHFSVIQFAGEDGEAFLQGQLSCDVRQAMQNHAQYGSYCTPKGRMLATFLLWRDDNGFQMQLPEPLREAIQKRLSMYVMRSKVKVSDVGEATVRLGIAGPDAAKILAELGGGTVPEEDYAVAQVGPVKAIRLPGRRYELVLSPEDAPGVWQALSKQCMPVGSGCWEWLAIQAGIPMVTSGTQEQFVPQMANLELIGGVSFTKGCFPGQEIVARSQYLGKVKRRMYLVRIQSDTAPQPGDLLYGQGPAEQSGGMIVNAQPSPQGGYDALAVILNASLESGKVSWKTQDGPPLQVLSLPYSVE